MGLYDYFPETQALQQPDILGNYLRGAFAPGQLTAQQQQNTMGGLQIQQLRMALGNQSFLQNYARQQLTGEGGNADVGSASPSVGRTGGIQNGPQDSVSGTATAPPSPASGYAGGAADSGSGISAAGSAMSPGTIRALSILRGDYDPIKTEQGIFEYQKQVAQLKAQGPMDLAESVSTSPNADQIIRNNPSLQQQWIQLAPKLGLNPFTDLTPQNARAAAILGYNNIAGSVGLPGKPMPDQMVPGAYGSQYSATTGKRETPPIMPTYSVQDTGWDPNTNKETHQLMMTSPGAPSAPGAPARGGAGGGGVGSFVGSPFSTYKAPTPENEKAAMFAGEFRGGDQTMSSMESGGYQMTPTGRTIAINMATQEDAGLMSQFLAQEIAANGLSAKDQTYLAAMMPMLQAAGHDQSGARLSTPQIRQNVESLLPMGKDNQPNMQQVHINRAGFYQGLLTQAGSALQMPQYRNSLLADQQRAQADAMSPPTKNIGGKAYYQVNGRWFDNPAGK